MYNTYIHRENIVKIKHIFSKKYNDIIKNLIFTNSSYEICSLIDLIDYFENFNNKRNKKTILNTLNDIIVKFNEKSISFMKKNAENNLPNFFFYYLNHNYFIINEKLYSIKEKAKILSSKKKSIRYNNLESDNYSNSDSDSDNY